MKVKQSKAKLSKKELLKKYKDKLVLVPATVLIALLSFVGGTQYESIIKDILTSPKQSQDQAITTYPKEAKVKRVIDGDTIELQNGQIVRYVGINAPNAGEPYDEEATEANMKYVLNKTVQLEYDTYISDRFERILAYPISNGKNIPVELVRKGLAKVTIYEDRKPLKYQDELLKAQEEARKKKRGIWSK